MTDADGDGYGDASVSGAINVGLDCDDGDAGINPDASENADGMDEDCDGLVDEGTNVYDDDGDSYPEDGGDCNDEDNSIYPGAPEVCDGTDNDCDGLVDDADSDLDTTGLTVMYLDFDGDGYGDPSTGQPFCAQPAGYVTNSTDCNDQDPAVNPGGAETLNNVDDDCDGIVDEGTAAYDDDGDGYSENAGDCDDSTASIFP